jgi:UPF0176 protein
VQKIILYYKFVPISDPESVMHWQRALGESLGLKGRILISPHGINGTLGGEEADLKKYKRAMVLHSLFKEITYKWSDGGAEHFPRLSIKVRDEIVTFGAGDELQVNMDGVVNGGKHLKPKQVHELVKKHGDDVIFFDGRNKYEARIGKFKNAVVPDSRTAKDFIRELEKPEMQAIKDKPIVTYCTGGIRCEILSSLMKNRGFSDVYQMDGGIAKYGEAYADDGFWEGKLFVFDNRMSIAFSDNSKDIGECEHCKSKTSRYINCANKACNELILVCADCDLEGKAVCSVACENVAMQLIND